jgi:hypothetical protein
MRVAAVLLVVPVRSTGLPLQLGLLGVAAYASISVVDWALNHWMRVIRAGSTAASAP